MERLALVGHLKNDSLERARELIRAGPAFEAKERGFTRLFILLSATEVIFVFEGHQVEWPVFGLQDTPWDWAVAERREEWPPRQAEMPASRLALPFDIEGG